MRRQLYKTYYNKSFVIRDNTSILIQDFIVFGII